jgi:hypothetical protein
MAHTPSKPVKLPCQCLISLKFYFSVRKLISTGGLKYETNARLLIGPSRGLYIGKYLSPLGEEISAYVRGKNMKRREKVGKC